MISFNISTTPLLLLPLSQLLLVVFILLLSALHSRHCSLALAIPTLQSPQSHLVIFHQLSILSLANLTLNEFCYIFSEQILYLLRLDDYFNC